MERSYLISISMSASHLIFMSQYLIEIWNKLILTDIIYHELLIDWIIIYLYNKLKVIPFYISVYVQLFFILDLNEKKNKPVIFPVRFQCSFFSFFSISLDKLYNNQI